MFQAITGFIISRSSGCFFLRRRARIRRHHRKARRVRKEMAARGCGRMGARERGQEGGAASVHAVKFYIKNHGGTSVLKPHSRSAKHE